MAAEPLLQLRDIRVSYHKIPALENLDMTVNHGEIHALVGNHRAGKSTIVKLLSGAKRKDRGQIVYRGVPYDYFTPGKAIGQGIGTVYQHTNIVPSLTAIENILSGKNPNSGFFRPFAFSAAKKQALGLLEELGIRLDPDKPAGRLTLKEQHYIEVAKALIHDPDLLILDELSAKLNPGEMKGIYPLLFALRDRGKSVIYISHNIDEIFEVADRVTILKDGRRLGTEPIANLDRIKLLSLTYSHVIDRKELKQENIELFNLKKYNDRIIKNIPVGVIILDGDHNVYQVNQTALVILKKEAAMVRHEPASKLFKSLDSEQEKLLMEHIYGRKQLEIEEVLYNDEAVIKVRAFPFKDEDYTFQGTIILIEDISADIYLKDYLMRMEKISSVAELAAGVAHEINNPLGIIHNYVELMKSDEPGAGMADKLTKVSNELTRIQDIVGNLLSFSRLSAVTETRVELTGILDDTLALLAHKLTAKGIEVLKEYPVEVVRITGDESKLKQLFMNLIINGIEVLDRGGLITVKTGINEDNTGCEVTISDNGPGIAQQILPDIFNPFFTTKSNVKNTGLGLSICQHIVELHNGIITASSEPGEGASFTVRFPL